MRTEATVIAKEGGIAVVETQRTSACEGCHKAAEGEGCSVCSLMGSSRKISTRAYDDVGAEVGDRVIIESATGRMLWYAALVFLLPLLSTLAAWGISTLLTEEPLWQIIAAVLGFVISLSGVMIYSHIVQKKRCDVRIVEILSMNQTE